MPTFSSCRGSRTCDGAATTWCWNRRAPARCSGFAIRRSRPPSPCCPHRNDHAAALARRFPGVELLAVLMDCQIVFKIDAARDIGLRPAEGDGNLVLWDFHDLLFHTRSTEGRHANPAGRLYPYAGVSPRRRRCGPAGRKENRSAQAFGRRSGAVSPAAKLLRERHSTRSFDDQQPITLPELSRFLDSTARVQSRSRSRVDWAAEAVRCSQSPTGRIRRITSSSSIWPSTNA